MSIRIEQYRALQRTRDFLRWLMLHRGRVTKRELRARASACLRHYPPLRDNGEPMFSPDSLGLDDKSR